MTVSEMIAHLQRLPGNALVVVDGFDSWGLDYAAAPEELEAVPVKPTSHGPSFMANDPDLLIHHTVVGAVVKVVHFGIGNAPE